MDHSLQNKCHVCGAMQYVDLDLYNFSHSGTWWCEHCMDKIVDEFMDEFKKGKLEKWEWEDTQDKEEDIISDPNTFTVTVGPPPICSTCGKSFNIVSREMEGHTTDPYQPNFRTITGFDKACRCKNETT